MLFLARRYDRVWEYQALPSAAWGGMWGTSFRIHGISRSFYARRFVYRDFPSQD